MRRKLLTAMSVVSLLLCAAMVVLWVRSYWREDAFQFRGRDGQLWQVASRQGKLWLDNRPQVNLDDAPLKVLKQQDIDSTAHSERVFRTGTPEEVHDADLRAKMAKVDFIREALRLESSGWVFHSEISYSAPWYLALLPTLVLPVIWLLYQVRTRLRRAANRCVGCGYDLRASPGRCPECGTPVAKTAEVSA